MKERKLKNRGWNPFGETGRGSGGGRRTPRSHRQLLFYPKNYIKNLKFWP